MPQQIERYRRALMHLADVMNACAYLKEKYRRDGLEYCKITIEKLMEVENGASFDDAFSPEIRSKLTQLRDASFNSAPYQEMEAGTYYPNGVRLENNDE